MIKKALPISVVGAIVAVGVAHANEQRCVVTDPTGTPLNIRKTPNGSITGSIVNGVLVKSGNTVIVSGKKWTNISSNSSASFHGGWVFSSYITCGGEKAVREAKNHPISAHAPENGQTTWSQQVEKILLARGFSPTNAYKYSRPRSILTNTENIQTFSKNPVVFARQLPSCYAVSESRNCKLLYSGWGDLYGVSNSKAARNVSQCRMTEAQRNYCRNHEFTTDQKEQGCGRDYGGAADLVVFDGPQNEASTKLALSRSTQEQNSTQKRDYDNVVKQNKIAKSSSGGIPMCKGHPSG